MGKLRRCAQFKLAMEQIKQLCSSFAELRLKSTQIFIVAGTALLALLTTLLCIGLTMRYEVDNEVANVADMAYWKDEVSPQQQIWYDKGIEELNVAVNLPTSDSQDPRNVLLFLVKGIDAQQLATARFHNVTASTPFIWDGFQHVARLRNSCSSHSRCDAASVATALFGGVQPNVQTVGVDSAVAFGDCSASLNATHQVQSIVRRAQLAGLRTGFVTTQRLTGATGSALYAHLADSSWECEASMARAAIESGCQDAAQQLLSSTTGQALNVLLGGGRQQLRTKVPSTASDPLDELLCHAQDGRNLLRDWRRQKTQQRARFELVQRADELQVLAAHRLDYLLGVFANGDLNGNAAAPTLQLMLNRTLQVLQQPKQGKGYLLLVESLAQGLDQLQVLNATLSELLQQAEDTQTLTLVLFTNGNYLNVGLDVSGETELIGDVYEMLHQDEQLPGVDLPHIISDNLLYAQGPRSSLFYGIREETYLAHALSYFIRS